MFRARRARVSTVERASPIAGRGPLAVVAVAATLVVLAASALGPYGYFIDELYYLSCARRPALGYVDHPPLAPWLLTLVRAVLGESLLAIRLLPALVGGALVWLAGR